MNVKTRQNQRNTSWDPLAGWYDGWMGREGSEHHRHLAIPALLALLDLRPGEQVLDVGAGQGVLAPHIVAGGGCYTGVDLSRRLLHRARCYHDHLDRVRFAYGDARRLAEIDGLKGGDYDAVTFLLSIQDMDPLEPVLISAAWALRPGGRLVLLMTHPCFRVPRQSGWGWDKKRQLRYRRIDRYLTCLPVPMKAHQGGATRSFHRPLQAYINGLAAAGLLVNQIREVPAGDVMVRQPQAKAERLANTEIPLFLGIRAIKMEDEAMKEQTGALQEMP